LTRQMGVKPGRSGMRNSPSAASNRAETPRRSATIKEIAQRLGVSHSTVSRALNDHHHTSEATKELVRNAARTMGYIPHGPARAMRGVRSSLVGLIIPDIQNDFYARIARVIAQKCAAESLQLVLAVSEDDADLEYQHALALREAHAGGIIVVPSARIERRTQSLLNGSATVQLVRTCTGLRGQSVGIDDGVGMYAATRHLLELGHRRLAFIGGSATLSTGRTRLRGFSDAITGAGLSLEDMALVLGQPRFDFARAATERILGGSPKDPRVTGIVVGGVELAVGALAAIRQARLRLPEDVSLVGYGDPDWFRLWEPPITTIDLPVEELASTTAALLFQMMHVGDGNVPVDRSAVRVLVEPSLLVRGTTRRIN
jgi:LacI family transcriptional regulator